MLRRAVTALAATCDDVVVVSARRETPRGEWRVIPDLRPGGGPLAGIETALARAESGPFDAVFVLASDLPLVGPEAVARLAALYRAAAPGTDAVAAAREGKPPFEPLCAVYSLRCRSAATALLDEGTLAAQALFRGVAGQIVEVEGEATSMNVNTPLDRDAAEARLRDEATSAPASSRST